MRRFGRDGCRRPRARRPLAVSRAAALASGHHQHWTAVDFGRQPAATGRRAMAEPGVHYASYLRLDQLLDLQDRESEKAGRPAHDEMLFIVVHQAYELWFKQILFELDAVQGVFAADRVDDRAIGRASRALHRIHEILKLGVHQLDVLETMTPLDFLDFRDLLRPASGFQSAQFRLLEIRLGLRADDRLAYEGKSFETRLESPGREKVVAAAGQPSLFEQLDAWLARTPFIELGGYRFREAYRQAVVAMLEGDIGHLTAHPTLDETAREAEVAALRKALSRFDALFDETRHAEEAAQGAWRMSWRALQAALFITLYRDEPALQVPFGLLSLLMDIDETMTLWRYRHALMVQRMIGLKTGTGGSSGHDYLARTAERHRVFGDLFTLSTYLIPRSALPPLPEEITRRTGLSYGEEAGT
ncbi:tryptophan 2,3-dioxygenase family protein [Inquilinus sp.]|uniref:tryptophan 2,3-dioxygenase family protein n=1 Tax=Inquilinus sp. TaxID=1932117 RepID=UPI0031D55BF1